MGSQTWTKRVKEYKGDLVTNSHSILAKWKKKFLSTIEYTIHRVNDVRQTKLHKAEPVVPEPGAF
jgi:hypothetical protein